MSQFFGRADREQSPTLHPEAFRVPGQARRTPGVSSGAWEGGMNLEWKGQPVAVRELGQGPPVVLVHGYPLDGAMWSGVARALSTPFPVFKPDLPGRGENPTLPAGTIRDYPDFIGAIPGQLPGPAGAVGFSSGGDCPFRLLAQ